MSAITLRGAIDGKPWEQKVEAKRFAHYVGNIRYWFAYHPPLGQSWGLQITHIDSGYRVAEVPHHIRQACLGDDKAAAKMTLDKLIEKSGADRVRQVLNNAVTK